MVSVEFASTLGLSDVNPVGGSVTGSGKALTLHESLQKHGGVFVADNLIVGQSFGGQGEYLGSKVSGTHPGHDEKAGVVDNEVEVLGALLGGPADEVITWGDLPCRSAETEGGQKLALGAEDEVADLCAGKRLVSEVVMMLDQLVPERGLLGRGHET